MKKTKVEFVIPFKIADSGDYSIKMNGKLAYVNVKIEPNTDWLEKVSGFKPKDEINETRIKPDQSPYANISKITAEFPYNTLPFHELENFEFKLKETTVNYLNRLIEVVRYKTSQYWMKFISERDILRIDYKLIEDNKEREITLLDFGGGLLFPIPFGDQASVNSEILCILENDIGTPTPENLFLDSINQFITRQFNDSVININIALETHIARYLRYQLTKLHDKSEAEKRLENILSHKLHDIMSVDFQREFGRSLKEEIDLWTKFNKLRNHVRKGAIHPHTRAISPQEAYDAIKDALVIAKWVMPEKQKDL